MLVELTVGEWIEGSREKDKHVHSKINEINFSYCQMYYEENR
jgi:hypothetical protein